MLTENLNIDPDAIAAFCQRNHIRWMAIFGSALRDDFGPESDVDVLVEFEPNTRMGLAFFGLADELSEAFGGRSVDLGTRNSLNRWIKAKVFREAVTIFGSDPAMSYDQDDSATVSAI